MPTASKSERDAVNIVFAKAHAEDYQISPVDQKGKTLISSSLNFII
jgi:hypothetical protein